MSTGSGSAAAPAPSSRWRDRAACRGIGDPELFFPAAETGPQLAEQEAAAKAVCARCAVQAECLAFALVALTDGIAGGATAAERRTHRGTHHRGRRSGAVAGGVTGQEPALWWPPECGRGQGREVTEAGRAAVRAGRPLGQVAREFGVSDRTVHRWAAHVRAQVQAATG